MMASDRMPAFLRGWRGNLLLMLISTGLSLAVAVWGYRALVPATPASVTGGHPLHQDYTYAVYDTMGMRISKLNGPMAAVLDPATLYRNAPGGRGTWWSVDEHGFREGPTEQPGDSLAFVLGGSTAFGLHIRGNENTFAYMLASESPRWRVVNAGVVAFTSSQELSQMVHHLDPHEPALYIVVDGWNDLRPSLDDPGTSMYRHGTLALQFIEAALRARASEDLGIQAKDGLDLGSPLPRDQQLERLIQGYIASIDKMHAFAQARGARLLMAFQPELGNKRTKTPAEQLVMARWEKQLRYLELDFPANYRRLISRAGAFCEERGIPYVNLNADPAFVESTETLFIDPVHPNEAGNRVIATLIGEQIENLK